MTFNMRPHFKCCEMVCESHLGMTCQAQKSYFTDNALKLWSLGWSYHEIKLQFTMVLQPRLALKQWTYWYNEQILRSWLFLLHSARTQCPWKISHTAPLLVVLLRDILSSNFDTSPFVVLHEGTLKVIAEKCTHLNWSISQCVELMTLEY